MSQRSSPPLDGPLFRFRVVIQTIISSSIKAETSSAKLGDSLHQTSTEWRRVAADLKERLKENDQESLIQGQNAEDDERVWVISPDSRIDDSPKQGIWGIDLKSPILEYPSITTHEPWTSKVMKTWKALQGDLWARPSPTCATRIQVFPVPGQRTWPIDDLRNMAVAILAHDSVFDDADRVRVDRGKLESLCRPHLEDSTYLDGTIDLVSEADEFKTLARIMCRDQDASTGPIHRWNFSQSKVGDEAAVDSIELRFAPGSTNANDTISLVHFTSTFLFSAKEETGDLRRDPVCEAGELGDFLREGAKRLGMTGQEQWGKIALGLFWGDRK